MPPYLSIGAVYRNEGPYLREWIEFHRLVGVERFFLYNNESTDDHLEVLAPYIKEGTVTWEDYPDFPPQLACYQRCIETHRQDSRWIALIDIDEFLFSPTGQPVSSVLPDFEQHALYFHYEGGARAVDEQHQPVRGHKTDRVSVDLLRINHYFTRSQIEREHKLNQPNPTTAGHGTRLEPRNGIAG